MKRIIPYVLAVIAIGVASIGFSFLEPSASLVAQDINRATLNGGNSEFVLNQSVIQASWMLSSVKFIVYGLIIGIFLKTITKPEKK